MNKQDKKQPEGKRLQRQMKITSIVFTERRHCIQETRRYIIQENVPKLKSLGFQIESTQVSKNSGRKPYKCTYCKMAKNS